ncbi:MAG: NAD(P)/FAD-dependent oxidoreductase [Hyphomicrobium sp.]|jgi:protoporphyrinogen oxidase
MAKVAVIGAGAMGLAAAYHALKAGHSVDVFEADRVAGGMAAHFDFDGLSLERFYHFVCKADRPTFELMEELGIGAAMKWQATTMGYYIDGEHHAWGDPISLLRFPKLDLISKLRYGLQMFLSTKRTDWSALETMSAKDWFIAGSGAKVYDVLWRRLFELKFFEHADHVSAAWIWTRIKRIGTSRRSLLQEELGYIEGGSQTLVQALVDAIERRGGKLHLGSAVTEIASRDGVVTGVCVGGKQLAYDAVIATVPTPLISRLVPGFSDTTKAAYDAIRNIGVVCVLLKLARPVSRHFWLNINDSRIDIPGLVEFSNLRPLPQTVVYLPYYMPQSHPKFARGDEAFVREAVGYLKLINPALSDADLLASHVGRLRYAQPVCEPGFLAKIPPIATPIKGLQIADTCYYYPEDRGISESVRYGKMMAEAVNDPGVWPRGAQ